MSKECFLMRKLINDGVFREVIMFHGTMVFVMITLKNPAFLCLHRRGFMLTASFVRAGTHFAALSYWCTRVRALTHPPTHIHTQILRN